MSSQDLLRTRIWSYELPVSFYGLVTPRIFYPSTDSYLVLRAPRIFYGLVSGFTSSQHLLRTRIWFYEFPSSSTSSYQLLRVLIILYELVSSATSSYHLQRVLSYHRHENLTSHRRRTSGFVTYKKNPVSQTTLLSRQETRQKRLKIQYTT